MATPRRSWIQDRTGLLLLPPVLLFVVFMVIPLLMLFAIGFNPYCVRPMKDILFDEKIGGSLHLALGNAYITTDNGNHSSIHMDIVQIQRPEFGGGEVWFDGVLIRKDGKFVPEELRKLDEL